MVADTLRDRIKAEVLDGILSMFSENDPVEMAAGYITDAVIAELGLREEHRERSYGNWPNQPQVIYRKQRRYTSDWKNDE